MVFDQVRQGRISDNIVNQIKNAIFTGIYRSGDKLPSESEFKKLFNVSRVAIREAMRSLQEMAFVTIKRGASGGAFVAQMGTRSVSDSLSNMLRLGKISISDIWEFRILVEPSISRLAAKRRNDWDIRQMEDMVSIREKAVKSGKAPIVSNIDFHQAIARASQNPIAVMVIDAFGEILMDKFKRFNLNVDDHKSIIKSHRNILECIKKKESQRVGGLMQAHLVDIKKRLNI